MAFQAAAAALPCALLAPSPRHALLVLDRSEAGTRGALQAAHAMAFRAGGGAAIGEGAVATEAVATEAAATSGTAAISAPLLTAGLPHAVALRAAAATSFDRVLCAPRCSGDGELRARPERWAEWNGRPPTAWRSPRRRSGCSRARCAAEQLAGWWGAPPPA